MHTKLLTLNRICTFTSGKNKKATHWSIRQGIFYRCGFMLQNGPDKFSYCLIKLFIICELTICMCEREKPQQHK